MVYCGKPSKGCGACRARKVKCDQATPECKRCIKTNRKCPGYRDQLSLLFRDETVAVSMKAQSTATVVNAAPRSGSTSDSSSPSSTSGSSSSASSASSPSTPSSQGSGLSGLNTHLDFLNVDGLGDLYADDFNNGDFVFDDPYEPLSLVSLTTDRRQQSICFCIDNFPWLGLALTGYDSDADLDYSIASLGEKAMMKGILAVGMANISRTGVRSQSLKVSAQKEYAQALKATNAAISHPKHATDDTTLTAILCLSLFEILTTKAPEKVDTFVEHTKGAVALLKLRGESQLVRSQGLQMFRFLRNEIIVSCLMRYYPIPPALLALSEKSAMLPGAPYEFIVSHQVCLFSTRINLLRIEDLKNPGTELDSSIIARAFAIDAEMEVMMNSLPEEFEAKIYPVPPGHYFGNAHFQLPALEGLFHVYTAPFTCLTVNHYRYGRIFVNEIILNRLKRMSTERNFAPTPEFKDLCYRLRDLVKRLALDICATVPYLCELIGKPGAKRTKEFNTAGGVGLLFPLYVAATVEGYPSECCHWIMRCLDFIGRQMGIDQALAIVKLLPVEEGMLGFIDAL